MFDHATADLSTFVAHYEKDINLAFRNAAFHGRLDIVRELSASAAINDLGKLSKSTALHAACTNGHVAIIRLLLELGARPDIRNAQKKLPFELATPEVIAEVGCTNSGKETAFKAGDTIVINTYNTNGIGDVIYAVRTHLLCRRIMPHVKVKTIITLDVALASNTLIINHIRKALVGDVSPNELYVVACSNGEANIINENGMCKYSDQDAADTFPFLLFFSDDIAFSAYGFIHKKSPKLQKFLLDSRVYLNLATELKEGNHPVGLTDKTQLFSFLELGGPKNMYVWREQPKIKFAEVLMGPFEGQGGMMRDELLSDLMKCVLAKDLTAHDFHDKKLYSAISNIEGHFAVGYMQKLSALCMAVAVLAEKSRVLKLLTNTNLIDEHALCLFPFNQFQRIIIFDKGSEHSNEGGTYNMLYLFPFNGLTNQDKRRYLMLSDSTLGSGDNSFMESLTVGKPFFWDIPSYKLPFVHQLAVLCSEEGFLHLAKLLYFNCKLCPPYNIKHRYNTPIIKINNLKGYIDLLKDWDVVVSETQRLCEKIAMGQTSFSTQLTDLLLEPRKVPEFKPAFNRPAFVEKEDIKSPPFKEFESFFWHDDTKAFISEQSLEKLKEYFKRAGSFTFEFDMFVMMFSILIQSDRSAGLEQLLKVYPFIDLDVAYPFLDAEYNKFKKKPLEMARDTNAYRCVDLLSARLTASLKKSHTPKK